MLEAVKASTAFVQAPIGPFGDLWCHDKIWEDVIKKEMDLSTYENIFVVDNEKDEVICSCFIQARRWVTVSVLVESHSPLHDSHNYYSQAVLKGIGKDYGVEARVVICQLQDVPRPKYRYPTLLDSLVGLGVASNALNELVRNLSI